MCLVFAAPVHDVPPQPALRGDGGAPRPPPRARPAAPETASPRGFHALLLLPLIHREYLCIFGVVAPEDQHPGTSTTLRFAAPKGLVLFFFFFPSFLEATWIYLPCPASPPPLVIFRGRGEKRKRTILDFFLFCFVFGKGDFVQLKKEE